MLKYFSVSVVLLTLGLSLPKPSSRKLCCTALAFPGPALISSWQGQVRQARLSIWAARLTHWSST